MPVQIEQAPFDTAESRQLIAEVCAEIDRIYDNPNGTEPALTGTDSPKAAFLIARDSESGAAVGCVALRPSAPHIGEVKRLYVRPAARGRGISRQLMENLERRARARGFTEIRLETGLRQPGAIHLYESLGYHRIAGYGEYKDDPENVCFAKQLD
ncbi:GNAT family N-acetyltransferase [soil metagenome]